MISLGFPIADPDVFLSASGYLFIGNSVNAFFFLPASCIMTAPVCRCCSFWEVSCNPTPLGSVLGSQAKLLTMIGSTCKPEDSKLSKSGHVQS